MLWTLAWTEANFCRVFKEARRTSAPDQSDGVSLATYFDWQDRPEMKRRALFTKPDRLLGSRVPMVSLIQMRAGAEHLNFRRAANVLGVSQSSVEASSSIPITVQ